MSTTTVPPPPPPQHNILLIGAGELGTALLHALTLHPLHSPSTTRLTLALRPNTLTNPARAPSLQRYRDICPTVHFLPLDISDSATTAASLADIFRDGRYDTIVHAGGMALPAGSMRKLTDAVLMAKGTVRRYIPWQFGVDYDALGPKAGRGLFAEQCGVREVLRGQKASAEGEGKGVAVQWLVVSCGIFMSFLFEEAWGVVVPDGNGAVKVRALGSWKDRVTATTVEDIARVTAELVLNHEGRGEEWEGNKVYIAGQTLSYGELADLVGRVTGKEVVRELWDRETIRGEMETRDGAEAKIWQYRAVFGGGEGVSWPKKGTWSERGGRTMEGIEGWLNENWKV